MMNLLHEHPSAEVRTALLQLLDALTTWERSTGRSYLVIVKDKIGAEYRCLNSCEVPRYISDTMLIENFKVMR